MRKLLGLLLLCASTVGAYEVKENPDRVPSLGVTYTGAWLTGDIEYANVAFGSQPEGKDTENNFMGDLRLPVNRNLTAEIGLGYAQRTLEGIDGSLLGSTVVYDTTKTKLSGAAFKAGLRYYFH